MKKFTVPKMRIVRIDDVLERGLSIEIQNRTEKIYVIKVLKKEIKISEVKKNGGKSKNRRNRQSKNSTKRSKKTTARHKKQSR